MKKIVITDALTVTDGDIDLRFFEAFGQLEIYPLTSYDEVADRIAEADIVLCNKTPLDRSILAEAPRLSYIGLFATGYNNIDIGFAKENGITVCNAGEYSTNAVAQHTFALLLEQLLPDGSVRFVCGGGGLGPQQNLFAVRLSNYGALQARRWA